VQADLTDHPDRLRWNAKYSGDFCPAFSPHPLALTALALDLPAGSVLELACGPSGSALTAAEAGRAVVAVDASDVALDLLRQEARQRGLDELISLVHADLTAWRPPPGEFALVLCTGYWDAGLFPAAAGAVRPGGVLGWEALTTAVLRVRPELPSNWCVGPGEPVSLLPVGWPVLRSDELVEQMRRRLLTRRPELFDQDSPLSGNSPPGCRGCSGQ
jgi:SAM-dependent methyltransferase